MSNRKSFLPLLTWIEARDEARRGAVVIVPIGTVEASSPHLPLGFDYIVAARIAECVADRTRNLWLAPVAFGVSEALDGFPGTVAIEPDVLGAQVEGVLRSLIKSGFERIVLVNNHGPNQPPVEYACRRVRESLGLLVPSLFPGRLIGELCGDLFEGRSETIGHGSEPGTSLLLHLFPDAVRLDLAEAAPKQTYHGLDILSPDEVRFGAGRVNIHLKLDEVSPTGGWGDPSQASAELGAAIFERVVHFTSDFVSLFASVDPRTGPGPRENEVTP